MCSPTRYETIVSAKRREGGGRGRTSSMEAYLGIVASTGSGSLSSPSASDARVYEIRVSAGRRVEERRGRTSRK